MQKDYEEPVFELLRIDEENTVFYAASGGVGGLGVGLTNAQVTNGEW